METWGIVNSDIPFCYSGPFAIVVAVILQHDNNAHLP
jgi:hypothetical protein